MWQIQNQPIPDVRLITLPQHQDTRGTFIKTFNQDSFSEFGIDFSIRESYFSISNAQVIRGMHFQRPPHHHAKIIFCPAGAILDVALDLRKASLTYGECVSVVLSAENHRALYIPEGFAHGFKALTDDAITYYLVSSGHKPDHDMGIRWNSFGFDWAVDHPTLSVRDQQFPMLADFSSPF